MPPTPEHQPLKQQNAPVGPTVGIVVIVLLLMLGALYFWGKILNNQDSNAPSYIPSNVDTDTGPGVSFEATTTLE